MFEQETPCISFIHVDLLLLMGGWLDWVAEMEKVSIFPWTGFLKKLEFPKFRLSQKKGGLANAIVFALLIIWYGT